MLAPGFTASPNPFKELAASKGEWAHNPPKPSHVCALGLATPTSWMRHMLTSERLSNLAKATQLAGPSLEARAV